jgi:hypothetical protein
MYALGFPIANFIRTMTWKAVQKAYPKVSKSIFNQIKRYKNKKSLKKSFDKKEGVKPKKKIVKKKTTTTTKPKVTPTTVTTAKKITDVAKAPFKGGAAEIKAVDKLLGNIPSGMIKYAWQHPIQTAAGTYAAGKAVDIGSKLFKGRAMTDTGNGQDIKSEVTGNGAETKISAPTTGLDATGTLLKQFADAHNTALNAGQSRFIFDGKEYTVRQSPMSGNY